MCAQLRVWQRTEPEQWQGRDRDLLPPTDPAHKRWRWLHWSAHLYPALTGDTRHKSDPRGRDDIRQWQWSQDSILNITQDDEEEENDASLIMVTLGA